MSWIGVKESMPAPGPGASQKHSCFTARCRADVVVLISVYMSLELIPISFKDACAFVKMYHRHHLPPVGHKYSIGAAVDGLLCGVIIVGRPVSRRLDNGFTLEVTRCCTNGHKNTCSFLYSAAWRAAKNMGYRRLITYVLKTESGTSLEASGWKALYETSGKSWSVPSRPRIDKHPLQTRILYEAQ